MQQSSMSIFNNLTTTPHDKLTSTRQVLFRSAHISEQHKLHITRSIKHSVSYIRSHGVRHSQKQGTLTRHPTIPTLPALRWLRLLRRLNRCGRGCTVGPGGDRERTQGLSCGGTRHQSRGATRIRGPGPGTLTERANQTIKEPALWSLAAATRPVDATRHSGRC